MYHDRCRCCSLLRDQKPFLVPTKALHCRACRLDEQDCRIFAPQCMTASPATHLALASIPGLTVLDQGRFVVISCEAELAAHYTAHVPAPSQFSLLQPYQAVAAGSGPNDALPGAAQIVSRPAADASGAAAVLPHADAHAAATADAEAEPDASRTARSAEQPISRRKRKRKASKALNEAETEVRPAASQLAPPGDKFALPQPGFAMLCDAALRCAQAAQRHAAFRPTLVAAQAALQLWLTASCGTAAPRTIEAALRSRSRVLSAGGPPDGTPQATTEAVGSVTGSAMPPGSAGACQAAETGSNANESLPELDFAALGHMKQAVRPMLTREPEGIVAALHGRGCAAPTAMGSPVDTEAEDVHEAPAAHAACGDAAVGRLECQGDGHLRQCNLYDVVMCNDGDTDGVAQAHEVLRQAPSTHICWFDVVIRQHTRVDRPSSHPEWSRSPGRRCCLHMHTLTTHWV